MAYNAMHIEVRLVSRRIQPACRDCEVTVRMLLDLTPVLHTPDAKIPFSYSLDLSDMDMGYQRPAQTPVQVQGMVFNRAGVIHFEATLRALLTLMCNRCAAEFSREVMSNISVVLVGQLQDEDRDDICVVSGPVLETDDLVVPPFVLDMPLEVLCREDCRGLCPVCGQDLNAGDCGCHA